MSDDDLRARVAEAIMRHQYPSYRGEPTHGQFDIADAVLAALPRYEQVGAFYCPVHAGLANEDDNECDFRQGAENTCSICGGEGGYEPDDSVPWAECVGCEGAGYSRCALTPVYRRLPTEGAQP